MARRPGQRLPPVFWIGTVLLLAAVVALAVLAFSGGDDDGGGGEGELLRVDLVDDALTAVTAELGEGVALYEVNATPELVNVFVQTELDGDTAAIAYVYEERGLGPAAEPQPATGPTFTADQVDFDPDTILDAAREELSGSVLRVFSIGGQTGVQGPSDAVEYRVVFDSVQGGSLSVMVQPDGAIIGVDAE